MTAIQAEPTAVVAEAVARAGAAQRDWALRGDRAEILRAAGAELQARCEEVMAIVVEESSCIAPKAFFEVFGAADELATAADAVALTEPVEVVVADPERRAFVARVPLGVIGVISPWNFPLLLSARAIAPALAAGNAVVLKADPKTPRSGGEVLLDVLTRAGLPEGVLCLVEGDAAEGEAIVRHPDVHGVSFTGSTEVGRRLGALAGGLLKPISLELGGNNAFIVLDDADPAAAASAGAWGAFLHQGQICMAASRHLVHRSLVDDYVAHLSTRAAALRLGAAGEPECQLAPVITDEAAERITTALDRARDRGALVDTGAREASGRALPPAVVTGLTADDPLARSELFGPVAVVIAFDTDDEAVALANGVDHGLVAGIYTSDVDRGRSLAERLDVGTVHVGDQSVNHEPRVPFAGTKASGNGHGFGGAAALDSVTRWRTVTTSAPRTYPF